MVDINPTVSIIGLNANGYILIKGQIVRLNARYYKYKDRLKIKERGKYISTKYIK